MTGPLSTAHRLLGMRLNQERLADISIEGAGKAIGISAADMVKLEDGKLALVSVNLVEDLADLYRMSPGSERATLLKLGNAIVGEKTQEPLTTGDSLRVRVARRLPSRSFNVGAVKKAATGTLLRRRPTTSIFISHRRSDQPALAGRLYDKLSAKFGTARVFMDVDSIDLGIDFDDVLHRILTCCSALLVVIGHDWLGAKDEDGRRRLDNPHDYVRLEIETALNRDIRVIPVLVDDTRMPRASELPKSLSGLTTSRDVTYRTPASTRTAWSLSARLGG